jgi:hypothetical protein
LTEREDEVDEVEDEVEEVEEVEEEIRNDWQGDWQSYEKARAKAVHEKKPSRGEKKRSRNDEKNDEKNIGSFADEKQEDDSVTWKHLARKQQKVADTILEYCSNAQNPYTNYFLEFWKNNIVSVREEEKCVKRKLLCYLNSLEQHFMELK